MLNALDALGRPFGSPPRADRHARGRSPVVHRERQNTGVMGFLTRCGCLWDEYEVRVTDEPVTCKTCLRVSP